MGKLETKWGKSWDAHQFTNPGMHADFRIPTCAPIPADQVTSLAKSCVPGCFAEQVTLLAKPRVLRNAHPIPGCAPNPCQFPNPGMHANSRVPERFAEQVTPLAKSRVLRDEHQFSNPGMRADSHVSGHFAEQVTPLTESRVLRIVIVTPLAKSRVLRDAHQFLNPGMRADSSVPGRFADF